MNPRPRPARLPCELPLAGCPRGWLRLPGAPAGQGERLRRWPCGLAGSAESGAVGARPEWRQPSEWEALSLALSDFGRGVSSVVRRCVHRATGCEFAVKIMEVTAERLSPEQLEEVREATRRETHILRQVAGHPHISEAAFPAPASPQPPPAGPAPPQPLSPSVASTPRFCSLPPGSARRQSAAGLWVPAASSGSPSFPVTARCCLRVEKAL